MIFAKKDIFSVDNHSQNLKNIVNTFLGKLSIKKYELLNIYIELTMTVTIVIFIIVNNERIMCLSIK